MSKKQKNKVDGYSIAGFLKRMFVYVRRHKTYIILYMVLSVLNVLISLAFANLINSSISSAVEGRQNALYNSILQTFLVVLAGLAITYFSTRIYVIFSSMIMLDVRNHAVNHLQKLPISFIENNHTGDIISRFTNDMTAVQTFIGDDLFKTVIPFVSLIITSIYLININWKLYIFSIIIIPPVLYLSTLVTKPIGGFLKECSVHKGKANSLAHDSYNGIFMIKAFNLEDLFFKRYSDSINENVKYSIKAIHKTKWLPPFNILLWSSPFTICLVYGAYLSINNEITPGQLPAFVYLLNNIVSPFSSLPRTISNYRSSLGTAQRFFEVIDRPIEREDGKDFDISQSDEYIRFKNVSFTYESSNAGANNNEQSVGREILKNLSFSMKKGSKIALVGISGCGKSTVLKLINAFYEHQEGNIELFGYDVNEWNIKDLRSKISFVSQDTYLFAASVYENIISGKSDCTKAEVIAAAKAANAHEFIMDLPEGYDTLVGERGLKLSGGQKQRIGLARAFVKNAPLILMDEPTSALDTISEAAVQEVMNTFMGCSTAVIVTHRLSTIKDVDEILVMDSGRIVERGTHESLISIDSIYSRLYNRQAESN